MHSAIPTMIKSVNWNPWFGVAQLCNEVWGNLYSDTWIDMKASHT